MSGTPYPNLDAFLASEIADADLAGWASDREAARGAAAPDRAGWLRSVLAEGRAALASGEFPWRELAGLANRDLPDEPAARAWLAAVLDGIEAGLSDLR